MVDVILMVALADDNLTEATLDRIARAIQEHSEFSGVSWEWVVARSKELALDAPLFSDTRDLLQRQLSDRSLRRLAISLAAKIVGAGRRLAEEERALLTELAFALEIDVDEFDDLFQTSPIEQVRGFLRSPCNDPSNPEAPSLFDSMTHAKTDDELRILTYKLCAIRRIVDEILPGAEVVSVCQAVRFGPHSSRVDAVIDLANAGQCLVRCIAEGEALHAEEHQALGGISGELKTLSFLMIVHQGALSPMDREFLAGLDPTRLRVEKVDIWEAVP